MTRLSIVIPCLQGASQFEATLVSVLQNRPARCEIIVLQRRPYDDPYDLASEVRFVEVPADCSLIDLINRGLDVAKGDVFHLLGCETEVLEGWADIALASFSDTDVGCVVPTLVRHDSPHQIIASGLALGSSGACRIVYPQDHLVGTGADFVGPTLAAGFYRRRALLELGGFAGNVGAEWIGVDAALAMRAIEFRAVHVSDCVVLSRQEAVLPARSVQTGRAAEHLFWRHAPPRFSAGALLVHSAAVTHEFAGSFGYPRSWLHLLGRVVGGIELVASRGRIKDRQQVSGTSEARGAFVSRSIVNKQARCRRTDSTVGAPGRRAA